MKSELWETSRTVEVKKREFNGWESTFCALMPGELEVLRTSLMYPDDSFLDHEVTGTSMAREELARAQMRCDM